MLRTTVLAILACLVISTTPLNTKAQVFEHAGEYMSHISTANQQLTAKYLFYLSSVSHGKSARKVEKRRLEVVNAINDTKYTIMGMPPWKGDKTLKDTTVAYLKLLGSVFNEDYAKIVNMEEIAEQSYDAMEAYLLAQHMAQEKLGEAAAKQTATFRRFAEKYNITLLQNTSEIEEKSKIASQVMDHANEIYLIFFKCHKQEAYLMDAVSKKNIVSLEQSISSLKNFAEEGKEKLKSKKGYLNDNSLVAACSRMMEYYLVEARKASLLTDYLLKEENFMKIKKKFDGTPAGKRTQQDVDEFNNAVEGINKSLKTFNNTLSELNKLGSAALNDWNKTYSNYLDDYIPKQQRS